MSYEKLIQVNKINYAGKKVIIIGAGWMADQYCQALRAMDIHSVTVVARTEESAKQCCLKYGYQPRHGGYREVLPKLAPADLVIIATPVHELRPAAEFAASLGYINILVEKPGALYSGVLREWAEKTDKQNARIRVAFNRQTYPSLWKLRELAERDGGITSCHYTFTEWVHTINFHNNLPQIYQRLGITNSLHVIDMAHALIGLPESMSPYRSGNISWHPTGARFSGAGVTTEGILFSYQADWTSAGRWGIEIMTPKNAYRLIPLEQLLQCQKGTVNWLPVEVESAFPNVKTGVAEEIAVMLEKRLEEDIPLIRLSMAAESLSLAENIFGYNGYPPEVSQ